MTTTAEKEPAVMPEGNWHAIEGPNGMCACGPVDGCPERLRRWIRKAIDYWEARARFLERERERALDELPDAWQRVPGSLAVKVAAYRDFVNAGSLLTALKAFRDQEAETSTMDHRNCLLFTMQDGSSVDDRCPRCISADDAIANAEKMNTLRQEPAKSQPGAVPSQEPT